MLKCSLEDAAINKTHRTDALDEKKHPVLVTSDGYICGITAGLDGLWNMDSP